LVAGVFTLYRYKWLLPIGSAKGDGVDFPVVYADEDRVDFSSIGMDDIEESSGSEAEYLGGRGGGGGGSEAAKLLRAPLFGSDRDL
jgi:hypothetical protein